MKNLIIYTLVGIVILFTSIRSEEYHVKKSVKNVIKFISDAPIENFEGVTNNIDGYLYFVKNLTDSSQLYFEVDLRTLDTGIGLRNRHMRENYLETDKYPLAAYSGTIISSENIGENLYKVKVKGEIDIHGIKREQNIEGTIDLSNNEMKISSNFIVKLSDHKIDIPKLMFFKIDENMDLHLDFILEKAK